MSVSASPSASRDRARNRREPEQTLRPLIDPPLLMIDWRFMRRSLLETTLGDQGSSMPDLIWKYRY